MVWRHCRITQYLIKNATPVFNHPPSCCDGMQRRRSCTRTNQKPRHLRRLLHRCRKYMAMIGIYARLTSSKHFKVSTGDNGTAWPVFAADDGHFNLFPFARSGATCSNNITPRPFPSVFESQLPLFFTEMKNGSLRLNPEETLFTLWIGTNDVGVGSLLTGGGVVGATVANTTMCAIDWVKTLYQSGFRNFLFQNVSGRTLG